MNYLEYTFKTPGSDHSQGILIALLNEEGYEGFIETDSHILAFLPEEFKNEVLLIDLLEKISGENHRIEYSCTIIPEKNWNEQWESDFQPIEVDSTVKIRASFHAKEEKFKYDLLIDPKMSFGTGHHATTRLMIQSMLMHDFLLKSVLDMGCGTGVLGILASKMGAKSVVAIDIDEWAFRNSIENVETNACQNVEVRLGSSNDVRKEQFDIILANINRNVLLTDMGNYFGFLKESGLLILSGIMEQDLDIILEVANNEGFVQKKVLSEKNWHSVIFNKS